ncbi:unnamed protein product [Orchesella dallaii]|uniref:Centrosomal protein n=1 Tax=Orchesella dallaii TaxID=48710 RepID=A0ABP1RG54_9HEXA
MVGPVVSEVEARFSKLRRSLDDGGYLESFGLDSLRLVEHLFNDLVKTTGSLQKTLEEYAHYKQVADELENGVAPFKEENIRLNKENSKLRMGIARAIEEADDKAQDPLSRLRDLEAENNDLKLLVSQFAERVKKSDIESLEKTKRIEKLQEKMLTANIVVTERNKRVMSQPCKQSMEVDYFVPDACPQCIRLRNFVEYNKTSDKNPKAVDYIKLADSRIEALQLQLRSLKNVEKENLSLITSLKSRVDTREVEIEKLRELIKIRPGRDNLANALECYDRKSDKMERNLAVGLKSAELQLQVLQRRNIELEDKLKKSIFQEHADFMLGNASTHFGIRNVPSGFLEKELDKYPSHDKMSLLEKLYYLERQLSHCCKEKAVLKNLLEECRLKHRDNEKYFTGKKSSVARSPRTLGRGRMDTSVRFNQQKTSLSKPTLKPEVHAKQIPKFVKQRFGEKLHVAKVSGKEKNPNKAKYLLDLEEHSELGSASDNEEEVSSENELNSRMNSVEEMETADIDELDNQDFNGFERQSEAETQIRGRTDAHVSNTPQYMRSGGALNKLKGKRGSQFISHDERILNPSKTSGMETGESRPPALKSSLKTHSIPGKQRNEQPREINKKISAALLSNPNNHIEQMDAYESDEYAYLDSEDEAEINGSDDHYSDDGVDETMEHVTTERHPSSKGERARISKPSVSSQRNLKISKPQFNVSQKKLTSSSKTTAADRRRPGAAFPTADFIDKSRFGGVGKTREQKLSTQKTHPMSKSKSMTQRGSKFNSVPSNVIRKTGNIDDDNNVEIEGREEKSNASADEMSDDFYVSDEDSENTNDPRVKTQYSVSHPQSHNGFGRAVTQGTGNSEFQRNVEPKNRNHQGDNDEDSWLRSKDSEMNFDGKRGSPEHIGESLRENEGRTSKYGGLRPLQDDDQKNLKSMKRGGHQATKHGGEEQQMQRGEEQMKRGGPQQMQRGEEQGMKRGGSQMQRGEEQMKRGGPQQMQRGEEQGTNRGGSQMRRGEEQMKRGGPQQMQRGEEQGMKRGGSQMQRGEEQMKSGEQQQVQRGDEQGTNRGGSQIRRGEDQRMQPGEELMKQRGEKQGMKGSNQSGPQIVTRGDLQIKKSIVPPKPVGASNYSQGPNKRSFDEPHKQGVREKSIPFYEDGASYDQAEHERVISPADSDALDERNVPRPSGIESNDFEYDEIAVGAAGDSEERIIRHKGMPKVPPEISNHRSNPTVSGKDSELVHSLYKKIGEDGRTSDIKGTISIDEVQGEKSRGAKTSTSNPLTAPQRQQPRYVSGLKDSGPQNFRHGDKPKEKEYLYADEKTKQGISAVEQPSLLSISGLERDPNDIDEETVTNPRIPVGNPALKNSYSKEQSRYDKPRQLTSYDDQDQDVAPTRKQPGAERRNEFEHLNPYNEGTSKQIRAQGQASFDRDRAIAEQYFREPSRNIRKDQIGVADIEFSRAGDTDATASYGEISDASYSRRGGSDHINRMGTKRGELSDTALHGKPAYPADRGRFGTVGLENSNLRNTAFEESRTMRSIGVNTEDHRTSLPQMERGDSHEKKTLFEKIALLQRKLDELHTDSSRHQLKSFELHGELERTKHMLQVEKQERELATSELRRLREQHNEATARMLMNSAIGSDGSFRRGTTPMELEREIVNLRAALSSLDRDKDEMRVELDRKDEKLARISNDASRYMDEVSQLKLRLKNSELQISHTGESAKEQGREVEFLKKQLEANRRDLEKTIRERDDSLKELHKISGVHAKGQMERRSVATELEAKSKEADDLRRQVQRYIDEVRRIEELLLDKEEEMEMLIQHYRALTAENNNLEAQRSSLEREASSIRESVRDTVDQNIGYKTQLASQNALVTSLEEEIQRLTQQISQLENQNSTSMEREKMHEADAKASRDLLFRLEIQMDKLKLDLADSESKRKQLEAEKIELTEHISSLELRLQEETERQLQLENLVANSREKDFQLEKTTLDISRERDELTDKLTNLQQRSETLNTEVSRYRLKSIELQNELDRTRRQLESEKRERETALSELRRVRDQLSSSSANYLLNTALGGSSGSQTGGLFTDSSVRQTASTSGSTFRHNVTSEVAQRTSREQSPLTTPYTPGSDLEAPIAASTTRQEEQPSDQFRRNINQTGDEFDAWDSPK